MAAARAQAAAKRASVLLPRRGPYVPVITSATTIHNQKTRLAGCPGLARGPAAVRSPKAPERVLKAAAAHSAAKRVIRSATVSEASKIADDHAARAVRFRNASRRRLNNAARRWMAEPGEAPDRAISRSGGFNSACVWWRKWRSVGTVELQPAAFIRQARYHLYRGHSPPAQPGWRQALTLSMGRQSSGQQRSASAASAGRFTFHTSYEIENSTRDRRSRLHRFGIDTHARPGVRLSRRER